MEKGSTLPNLCILLSPTALKDRILNDYEYWKELNTGNEPFCTRGARYLVFAAIFASHWLRDDLHARSLPVCKNLRADCAKSDPDPPQCLNLISYWYYWHYKTLREEKRFFIFNNEFDVRKQFRESVAGRLKLFWRTGAYLLQNGGYLAHFI